MNGRIILGGNLRFNCQTVGYREGECDLIVKSEGIGRVTAWSKWKKVDAKTLNHNQSYTACGEYFSYGTKYIGCTQPYHTYVYTMIDVSPVKIHARLQLATPQFVVQVVD